MTEDSQSSKIEISPMIESTSEDYNTDPNLVEDSSEEAQQIQMIEKQSKT